MAWPAMTADKRGKKTISKHPAATISPETATSSRFARVPSTSNPAGTWQIAAAIEDAAIASPIAPASQCSDPFRKTDR